MRRVSPFFFILMKFIYFDGWIWTVAAAFGNRLARLDWV
jgi:hypothetical protein